MSNIAQLKEQLNAKKKEIKDSRADAKAMQFEITKEIEKEHNRIKILLSDILIKTAVKEEKVKETLLSSISSSENCKDDIEALFQLINVKKEEPNSKPSKPSKPSKQSTPPAETDKQDSSSTDSDTETDKQDSPSTEPDTETDKQDSPSTEPDTETDEQDSSPTEPDTEADKQDSSPTEPDTEADKQDSSPTEPDRKMDEQADQFTGQSCLAGERTNASSSY